MASMTTTKTISRTPISISGIVDRPVGEPERDGQHPERHEGADHEDVAMGEVDQLDDAVDHRVAEGHEGVDRPERHRVHELRNAQRKERKDERDDEDDDRTQLLGDRGIHGSGITWGRGSL